MLDARDSATRAGPVEAAVHGVLTHAITCCSPRVAAVGVDVVDIASLDRDVEVGGERFLRRVFTPAELRFCAGRHERLASRFAAKEAVVKVLGTGIRGVDWHDVEIASRTHGAPTVTLHREAVKAAQRRRLAKVHVSLCHEAGLAIAVAIGEPMIGGGSSHQAEEVLHEQ